ncbi:hypothetical protein [Moorena producens]
MGRWGVGEMGSRGDGEMGSRGGFLYQRLHQDNLFKDTNLI